MVWQIEFAPSAQKQLRKFDPKVAKRIIGFFVLLFSSFVLLPIPLSNFVPGLGVLIISFGLLGKDGLVIILGIVVGGFGMALSLATLMLGAEFITSFF